MNGIAVKDGGAVVASSVGYRKKKVNFTPLRSIGNCCCRLYMGVYILF